MTLRIAIVPASTQAGSEAIRSLLSSGKDVQIKGIYRNTTKAPEDFTSNPNYQAVQGGISDNLTLDFSNTDAVFYIPPVTYDGSDTATFAQNAADRVKAALSKANVQRLLIFSAVGSQHENIGILKANTITDRTLATAAPEVIIAQGGWFMENWASALTTIENETPYFDSFLTPTGTRIPMISMSDIGIITARLLLQTGQTLQSQAQYHPLHGPRLYSPDDVGKALQNLTGKKIEVRGVPPEKLQEYYRAHVHPVQADELVEMTLAMNKSADGVMWSEEGVIRGEVELEEAMRRLLKGEVRKGASGAF
ncbi:putative NAD(P)H-binding protein 3 [Elsinoe fawcettii]|nr:putative NAD(P)H-binding protein 3 [Elsinoe fawcettii]